VIPGLAAAAGLLSVSIVANALIAAILLSTALLTIISSARPAGFAVSDAMPETGPSGLQKDTSPCLV
jgi:hypothetical protein